MDERAWLACTEPEVLLPELHALAGERKLRLFAVACFRSVRHLLEERSRRALEVVEASADGRADAWDLSAAEQAAREARRQAEADYLEANDEYEFHLTADEPDEGADDAEAGYHAYASLAAVGDRLAAASAAHRLLQAPPQPAQLVPVLASIRRLVRQMGIPEEVEKGRQSVLLREVAGNPFRPVRLHPAWLGWADHTVPRLAEAIYEEKAFDSLPILADALEDAGCTSAGVLSHLRSAGPHVRGCWAVDLLLGLR